VSPIARTFKSKHKKSYSANLYKNYFTHWRRTRAQSSALRQSVSSSPSSLTLGPSGWPRNWAAKGQRGGMRLKCWCRVHYRQPLVKVAQTDNAPVQQADSLPVILVVYFGVCSKPCCTSRIHWSWYLRGAPRSCLITLFWNKSVLRGPSSRM